MPSSARKKNTASSVGTGIALIVATRELVALAAALLAVSLTVEIAGVLGREFSMRVVAALAADFAVLIMLYILGAYEGGVPGGYQETKSAVLISWSLALECVYGGSIVFFFFDTRHSMIYTLSLHDALPI